MDNRAGSPAPFDEPAALEALERVRERIQQHRAQRREIQDEFSRFVRSFKTESPIADPASGDEPHWERRVPDAALPRVAAEPPPDVREPVRVPLEPPEFGPAAVPLDHDVPPVAVERSMALPAEPELRRRGASWTHALVGGGLILLAGGTLTTWIMRAGGSEPASSTAQTPATAPAPASLPAAPAGDAPVPASPSAPAAAQPSSSGSELVTIRRVWIRVLVDGERVLEREVPADTRVPLAAQKTIVIRTGDAGAVRLSIGGTDHGFLGREGEVVTRSFTVPARVR